MKACFPRSGCGRPWQLSTYKAKLLMSEIILSAVALFQQTSEAAGMCEWRQMGAGPVKKRWKQDAKGESAVAAAPQWPASILGHQAISFQFRLTGECLRAM
jgi:hypothetical protein